MDSQPGSAETVAGLRRSRPGDPTVEVLLGSGERVRIHDRRLVEHRLAVGDELDPAACDALRDAGRADAAERRALRLIAIRPRSRAELRLRMGEWGLTEAGAAAVLERLRVSDDARAVAHTTAGDEAERARQALRSHGAPDPGSPAELRRAAGFLHRRGFDADTVAAVLGLDADA